jgi:glyoxylase-like metal-dependent hydrolase (beta-lactamase superfamily II)
MSAMPDIQIGSVTIKTVVEVAEWRLPARTIFPELSAEGLAAAQAKWGKGLIDLQTEELIMAINCFLIETPDQRILVDTGNGNDKNRPFFVKTHHMFSTPFLDELGAAGATPEQIDIVVSTHLHPDHCGWNTRLQDGMWVPTFPNATYLLAEAENNHFRGLYKELTDGCISMRCDFGRAYADSILPVVEAGLTAPIAFPHTFFDDGATRVWAEEYAGHTPGHLTVHVSAAGHYAIISGDIIHHPFQVANLGLIQDGDVDTTRAARQRKRLAELCLDVDAVLMAAHFPAPTLGRFTGDLDDLGFAWL